jgi:hypothetical protein
MPARPQGNCKPGISKSPSTSSARLTPSEREATRRLRGQRREAHKSILTLGSLVSLFEMAGNSPSTPRALGTSSQREARRRDRFGHLAENEGVRALDKGPFRQHCSPRVGQFCSASIDAAIAEASEDKADKRREGTQGPALRGCFQSHRAKNVLRTVGAGGLW